MNTISNLTPRERWKRCLDSLALADTEGHVMRELEQLHAQKHRAYHNLDHVMTCLRLLDRYGNHQTCRPRLELAFWFHDAIYRPLRSDNEEASAHLASRRLVELGAPRLLVADVVRLILATRHRDPPQLTDEQLLVDIDLAVLGAPTEEYDLYEKAIRREYRMVPGPIYRRERRKILQSFLDRTTIYATESFRSDREHQARLNLERAIAVL